MGSLGWGASRGGGGGGEDDFADWMLKLFVEDNKEADDSDDLVYLEEVMPSPMSKSCSVAAEKPCVKDLDDDCVVLEGNPDKPAVTGSNAGGDSDDLLIVGEKGQVACRDYPHSRPHCATLPFASTPHEKYCKKCHCYVCDSPVPCAYWGDGTSSFDHCHATDEDKAWKFHRENFKLGQKAPLPSPILPRTSAVRPLQPIQVPPQVSRPNTIPVDSGMPNIINQGGRLQACIAQRNKRNFNSNLVSQQLQTTDNSMHGRQNLGKSEPQFINSHTVFKRARSTSCNISSGNAHVAQSARNPCSMTASNDKNTSKQATFSNTMNWELSTGDNFENILLAQLEGFPPPNLGNRCLYTGGQSVRTSNGSQYGFHEANGTENVWDPSTGSWMTACGQKNLPSTVGDSQFEFPSLLAELEQELGLDNRAL
ncbi:Legumain [Bertholletia excelsa]